MSLRLIARDLYRLQNKVDELQKKLAHCPMQKRQALERKIAEAIAGRDQVKRMLDGHLDR